jgi:hypothetical protein
MNRFRFEFGSQISELLTNHFSLMSALCVPSSDGTEGQRKSTFSMENVESHHPVSKSIMSSADGTEDQIISTDSIEMDHHISQSCVLSPESTDAQPISINPVQPVEIRLFTVKSGLYPALDSFIDAFSSALLIVAIDFSQISALNRILPGHQYVQSGRYRLTLEDLTCPSHRFSELYHQAPCMFVRPQTLMPRDVSDCEILCYDPAVISMMDLLQRSRFIFFLPKKQFDRIRSTVPVQFSSVFNFHQHPAFSSCYDRDYVCLLDRSSGYLDHLPFPDMRDFDEDIADKIRQWAEIPPCPHCGAILLRGMSHEFDCKPFAGRITNHLPPAMGRELLDHIIELTQSIPNFSWILNRDLRPILQHARVLLPDAGASNVFISGISYALDSYR